MPKHYLFLIVAVISETIGTASLQSSQQFTKLWPSIFAILSFLVALYFMSLALKVIPVGILYAMWSGLGIVSISVIAWIAFDQRLDFAAMLGIALILAGIMTIHLFSNSSTH
ncbi:MAG: SMR family transporter [Litoreibacter sp.]